MFELWHMTSQQAAPQKKGARPDRPQAHARPLPEHAELGFLELPCARFRATTSGARATPIRIVFDDGVANHGMLDPTCADMGQARVIPSHLLDCCSGLSVPTCSTISELSGYAAQTLVRQPERRKGSQMKSLKGGSLSHAFCGSK